MRDGRNGHSRISRKLPSAEPHANAIRIFGNAARGANRGRRGHHGFAHLHVDDPLAIGPQHFDVGAAVGDGVDEALRVDGRDGAVHRHVLHPVRRRHERIVQRSQPGDNVPRAVSGLKRNAAGVRVDVVLAGHGLGTVRGRADAYDAGGGERAAVSPDDRGSGAGGQ